MRQSGTVYSTRTSTVARRGRSPVGRRRGGVQYSTYSGVQHSTAVLVLVQLLYEQYSTRTRIRNTVDSYSYEYEFSSDYKYGTYDYKYMTVMSYLKYSTRTRTNITMASSHPASRSHDIGYE